MPPRMFDFDETERWESVPDEDTRCGCLVLMKCQRIKSELDRTLELWSSLGIRWRWEYSNGGMVPCFI
jgi:hypothetical protein